MNIREDTGLKHVHYRCQVINETNADTVTPTLKFFPVI